MWGMVTRKMRLDSIWERWFWWKFIHIWTFTLDKHTSTPIHSHARCYQAPPCSLGLPLGRQHPAETLSQRKVIEPHLPEGHARPEAASLIDLPRYLSLLGCIYRSSPSPTLCLPRSLSLSSSLSLNQSYLFCLIFIPILTLLCQNCHHVIVMIINVPSALSISLSILLTYSTTVNPAAMLLTVIL